MKKILLVIVLAGSLIASEDSQLTVYNQQFGVVKQTVNLDLKQGDNVVMVTNLSRHLEPDSVILKDKSNPNAFKILEQNYETDPLSEGLLLMKNEGKEIEVEIVTGYDEVTKTEKKEIKKIKIIRSGYVPHADAFQRYGGRYQYAQMAYGYNGNNENQPIIEMDGKLMFSIPGKPIFDSLGSDSFLSPTIMWKISSAEIGKRDAELSYITGGMQWSATYNCIISGPDDKLDIIGWVDIDNQSGKDYKDTAIKLMAGDVSKLQQNNQYPYAQDSISSINPEIPGQVGEKSFDEYHLYALPRKVDLLDRETKQVEFIRTSDVKGERRYVYDGLKLDNNYRGWNYTNLRSTAEYGTLCNPKVWNMYEIVNSKSNNLGMPLPKGAVKIYRKDVDNRNEFVGEDTIDHTPADEKLRFYMGNVFDIVGERQQIDFKENNAQKECEEEFKITLKNHKKEKVVIYVVEHLYRGLNWEIMEKSDLWLKKDSKTIEFRVEVEPDKEKEISYRVKYSWN